MRSQFFHFQFHLCRRYLVAALMASLALAAAPVGAQPESDQPVRLIVGYAAGGPVDAAARLFAPVFAKELGRPVVVENRPGAGGVMGGDTVAKGNPNGSVLFFAASPTITISPHILKKMAFDPAKDLKPIAPILSYANVLVVGKEQPFKNVKELLAYAKANPGKLTYGSAGVGASNHLSGELFAKRTGSEFNHIPYKGNAPAMTDVIGGQLNMMFDIVGSARNHIASGRVRALAVTSRERNASMPDVPTMREEGIADYEVNGWYGLYGPAKLPAGIATRYSEAARKALDQAALRDKLVEQGYDLWLGTPKTLSDRATKELAMWATVTKGIQVE